DVYYKRRPSKLVIGRRIQNGCHQTQLPAAVSKYLTNLTNTPTQKPLHTVEGFPNTNKTQSHSPVPRRNVSDTCHMPFSSWKQRLILFSVSEWSMPIMLRWPNMSSYSWDVCPCAMVKCGTNGCWFSP